ncbi:MAG: MBL fold metallo-hydrolase [bacterium]
MRGAAILKGGSTGGMIIESLTVGPFMENVFILGCGETGEAAIIDPGAEAESILERVESLGLTVKRIIGTHCHIDHVGAVQEIREKTGAGFYIHRNELPLVESYDYQCGIFGVRLGEKPVVDGFIEEGDIITVGNVEAGALLTPGHSPGGLSFVAGDAVFAGDTLFAGSIGRTDLPGGSYDTLIRAIREKLLVLPAETRVYCGHGPETTIGREKWTNPFLV